MPNIVFDIVSMFGFYQRLNLVTPVSYVFCPSYPKFLAPPGFHATQFMNPNDISASINSDK